MLRLPQDSAIDLEDGGSETCGLSSPFDCAPQSNKDDHEKGRLAASIFYRDRQNVEKEYQNPEGSGIPRRPFTSMDGPVDEETPPKQKSERRNSQRHRTRRSTENLAEDPALEIAMARSRLRAVAPRPQPAQAPPEPSRGRAYTIDELNTMLDDAIKSHSPKPGAPESSSDEQPTNLAPKPGFVLRKSSTRLEHRQSQSQIVDSRKATESVEPRTSDESMRVQYEGDGSTQLTRPQDDANQDSADHSEPHELTSPVAPQLNPLPLPDAQLSPVKQRAALYESLSQKPTGHDATCQHYGHEHDPTHDHVHHHPGPPRKGPKKVHRIKFGDRIEERPATPLIPLTLPTLVSTEKTARPQSALAKESEVQIPVDSGAADPSLEDVFKVPSHERKSSLTWPFKWGIFNKGASAPPQESEGVSAPAGAHDAHYPITRPSVVRSKVQKILQAVEEKGDTEQRRRDTEPRLSRRPTRTRPPSRRHTGMKRVDTSQDGLMAQPLVKTPQKEASQSLQQAAAADEKPRTPLQRAMSEKQVLAPPPRPEPNDTTSSGPRKSLPHTPVRPGPSVADRPTLGEQKHSLEQQFNLSPTRNGSKQRQGVKVEVEIRDSPEREARDRGEKIVIIRADVASETNEEEK